MARVLVIEDDKDLRSFIVKIMKTEKHEVVAAANGAAGMKLLQENPVDLVITDIFMPEQDGISTIIELQSDYPAVKIIVISGGGRLESVNFLELATNLGADQFLQKPFSVEEMVAMVRGLLR